MEDLRHEQPRMLIFSEDDRAMLLALADDLPRVWNHRNACIEIRKRILRAVLMEIVVTRSMAIDCAWSCIGRAEITPDLKC